MAETLQKISVEEIARQFLNALGANDRAGLEQTLTDEVGMRVWSPQWAESYRPRPRVIGRLLDEWASWPDPTLEITGLVPGPEAEPGKAAHAAVEFRILATEQGRYIERNRAAFLTLRNDKIELIDLYDTAALPSAHRQGWIAPDTISRAELGRAIDEFESLDDPREQVWPNSEGRYNLEVGFGGSGNPHPGSNGLGGARFTPENAEHKIEERIDYFRKKGAGFRWFVGPYDTPADLGERLERHGLILAGSVGVMARLGLEPSDIPFNPEIELVRLSGDDEKTLDDMLEIIGKTFHWTPEQIAERRPGMLERLHNPKVQQEDISYMARLEGKPVAYGRVFMKGPLAYLGGAGTLPEYRNRKVYSTLLRRRLQEAHDRGYGVALIHAGPMSRRVVERYGFREYGRQRVYAWMPVVDMEVIRTLVPND